MADVDILKAAGRALRKGATAAVAATMAITAAVADVEARPSRDDWVRIRTEQGRATDVHWNSTSILLAYQSEIARQCEVHDVVVVEKSRRTGATWGAAADAVLRSASPRSNGGMDTLYMGTSHDMAKEFIDAAGMWAKLYDKAITGTGEIIFDDGSENGIKALKIDFASGYSIVALSSKPRSLRGRQGFAILDEAAFVDNLGELIKAAMAFLIWGGKVLIISTHNGVDNPFNQLITDIRAGRLRYGLIRFDLDDALKDGLFERICLMNAHKHGEWTADKEAVWREELINKYGDGADEELYCIPAQGSGAWLTSALIEARMVKPPPGQARVLRLSLPADFVFRPEPFRNAEIQAWIEDMLMPVMAETVDPALMSAFGHDVARHRDASVMLPIQIGRTLRRIVPFVVELHRVPFVHQEQIRNAMLEQLPRLIGGCTDATGLGAQMAESAMLKFGPSFVEVKLSTEWYRTEMPPLKDAFEQDNISLPADADHVGDLRLVRIIRGVAQIPNLRTTSSTGEKRHGDYAVALALAYSATRMTVEAYGYESARTRQAEIYGSGLLPTTEAFDNMMPDRGDGLW
ncbi:terminase family protein [Bosea sp. 2KB_26]|uniref:terminase large subunit domain-containing protein n=1 Tax=Bosea sp. 2KB_26 TaxID=3237475 RepID=UPI003F8FC111